MAVVVARKASSCAAYCVFGSLIYSNTGNFASDDAEELLDIGKLEDDHFLASKQINVI